jgi:hypothetical protein
MRIILALILALGMALPAKADAVQDVISSQLDAFKADDFETAFTYASPTIKGIFGSVQRFGQMVRQGYPMVHRPADVQFIGQDQRGDLVYQQVLIQDQQGAFHALEYEMIPTENGWKINGVRFIAPPEVAA